ncbi:uncharacterized [Tachysurus ichikawai]
MKAPSQLNLSCNCRETQRSIAISGERHLSAMMKAALISSDTNLFPSDLDGSHARVVHATARHIALEIRGENQNSTSCSSAAALSDFTGKEMTRVT